jgi:hypothetical protein
MTDLFNSPVLLIEQPSKQLNYQITDPQGAALAYVTQVAGNQPKTGFAGAFADPDRSRVVAQVARPDGTPLFFVDRAASRHLVGYLQAPCAVVTPDGQLIGIVEHDLAGRRRSTQAGGTIVAGVKYFQKYRLLDNVQQPLCQIMWEEVVTWQGGGDSFTTTHSEGGRYAIFVDMNGTQIAHLDTSASNRKADRFTLQIGYQLPEPLRTLVIAAPLAMDLMPGS